MKWILIVCLSFCFLSCSKKDSLTQYLNKQIENHYSDAELAPYDFIVVIPRRGCHTCIHAAETFFYENKDNPKFLFVFSRIDSKKKLGLEIGKKNLELKNVKIDMDDLFYNPEFYDSNYPLLLSKQQNGKFIYQKLTTN
ncbi:hypothetical protein [Bacteroides fragilis]|uniref:hypothetical protein n=1 Tax=Bacteroides fragilis TaxID=817 RepID=UPI001C70A5CD|nr:hypothetical protein [Bacteroides fragilis]MBW9278789.1 hypothetical protein [Bacteroides fragilis]